MNYLKNFRKQLGQPRLFRAEVVETFSALITGNTAVGQQLSVNTSGVVNPQFQWRLNGTPISGATSSTYTILAGDVGGTISCVVSIATAGRVIEIPAPTISASSVFVNEGSTITFSLTGQASTQLSVVLTGVIASDIVGGQLTRSVTLNGSGTGSFTVDLENDAATEGAESITATIVGTSTSVSVTINDTSTTPVVADNTVYLPLTPAPQFAYSTERLWSAHNGPLLRGIRASDSTGLTFNANVNGVIDTTPYAAFAGADDLTVDRWYDQAYSVNGGTAGTNDATATTNRPRLRTSNVLRGQQPVSTGLISSGQVGTARLSLPAVVNSRQSITRIWVGAIAGGTFNSIGFWGYGVDGNVNNNLSLVTATPDAPVYIVDNGFNSGKPGAAAQLAIYTYVSAPTYRRLYINGELLWSSTTGATASTLTGGWIGSASWSAATIGTADMVTDIGWTTPLTDAERISFEQVLAARHGINYGPFTKLIAYDGHSIMAGLSESGHWQNLQRKINNAWVGNLPKTPNFAISGQTASQINGRKAGTATRADAPAFANKALVAQLATNSIEALVSGSIVGGGTSTYTTHVLPYIQYMQTTGGFGSNIVMLTEVPRGWTGSTTDVSQKEAERLAYNQALKDGAAVHGYIVVDWGGLSAMTTGVASGGNPNPPNPTYYGVSTSVHPNPAGYELCRALLQPVLESLLSGGNGVTLPLIAEYKFEEASGQIITDSFGDFDGSLGFNTADTNGDPTRNADGLMFNGSNVATVESDAAFQNADVTVVAIVKVPSLSGSRNILSRDDGTDTNRAYQFRLNGNKMEMVLRMTDATGVTPVATTVNLTTNQFMLLTYRIAPNKRDYVARVNGTSALSGTLTADHVESAGQRTCIGARFTGATSIAEPLNGTIRYLSFSRGTTDTEMAALEQRARDFATSKGISLPSPGSSTTSDSITITSDTTLMTADKA